MKSQAAMVQASLIATAAHDMNGVRRRHPSEADRLRVELAAARESRAALMEAYLKLTGRAS